MKSWLYEFCSVSELTRIASIQFVDNQESNTAPRFLQWSLVWHEPACLFQFTEKWHSQYSRSRLMGSTFCTFFVQENQQISSHSLWRVSGFLKSSSLTEKKWSSVICITMIEYTTKATDYLSERQSLTSSSSFFSQIKDNVRWINIVEAEMAAIPASVSRCETVDEGRSSSGEDHHTWIMWGSPETFLKWNSRQNAT